MDNAGALVDHPTFFMDAIAMFLLQTVRETQERSNFVEVREVLGKMVSEGKLSCAHVLVGSIYMHRLKHMNPQSIKDFPNPQAALSSAVSLANRFLAFSNNLDPHHSPSSSSSSSSLHPSFPFTPLQLASFFSTLPPDAFFLASRLKNLVVIDLPTFSKWKACIEAKVIKLKQVHDQQLLLKEHRKALAKPSHTKEPGDILRTSMTERERGGEKKNEKGLDQKKGSSQVKDWILQQARQNPLSFQHILSPPYPSPSPSPSLPNPPPPPQKPL